MLFSMFWISNFLLIVEIACAGAVFTICRCSWSIINIRLGCTFSNFLFKLVKELISLATPQVFSFWLTHYASMLLSKIADWHTYCTLLPSNISLEQKHYDHICSLWMCFDGNKSAQPHHKPTFSHPNARLTWWNVFFNSTKMFRTLLWSTSYRDDYCCSAGTIISVEFLR